MGNVPPVAFGWATFGLALAVSLLLWAGLVAAVLAVWWWI